jgi:hypothetical protein
MLPIVFAVTPALYAWSKGGIGVALLVAVASYAAFVAYAWVQSRKVGEIDFAFSALHSDLRRKRLLSQVIVPSVVGWPMAWWLTSH